MPLTMLQTLGKAKTSIAALVLLGFCGLIALDMSANYMVIYSLAGNGIFLAVAGLLALFSAAVFCWAALKLDEPGYSGAPIRMKNGALVGAVAALFICAIMVAMAYFGAGIEKLMPRGNFDLPSRAVAYALLCVIAVFAYALLGAMLGVAACWFFAKLPKKKKEMKEKLEPPKQHAHPALHEDKGGKSPKTDGEAQGSGGKAGGEPQGNGKAAEAKGAHEGKGKGGKDGGGNALDSLDELGEATEIVKI